MIRLGRRFLIGTLLQFVPLVVLVLVVHLIIGNPGYVLDVAVVVAGALSALTIVQSNRTTRNADIAAALARGTGTYIVGDKVRSNMKPATQRLGVPLEGLQPGAVPYDMDANRPLITETPA